MPTYDYQCQTCGHAFEIRQGFDATSMTDCPRCGQLAHRLFRPVPIIFKGSGWYVTDYGHGKGPTVSSTDGKSEEKPPATKVKEESKAGEKAKE